MSDEGRVRGKTKHHAVFADELTEAELWDFVNLYQDESGGVLAIATPAMQARLDLLIGDRTVMEPPELTYGISVRRYTILEGQGHLRVMKVSGEGEVLMAVVTGGVLRK